MPVVNSIKRPDHSRVTNEEKIHDLPSLKDGEEVKEEKRRKIATPNKLLTRLPA